MASKTVFITGANGYLGSAVARTFAQRGWTTYGLIRRERSALNLKIHEVIPVVATAAEATKFVAKLPSIDVIITCDEDLSDYATHQNSRLAMIKQICTHSKTQGSTLKPLVIFTSGCKDYGMTALHGEASLAPHTEETQLNPPDLLRPRTEAAKDMLFKHTEDFDCVATRPTTLFGLSGSGYAHFFALADEAKERSGGLLELPASPDTILHGTHVDDVAAAYIALATAPRKLVSGQTYNISARRYETLGEIVPAMEISHGVEVRYRELQPQDTETFGLYTLSLFTWPQWVGSEKIRNHLGWSDTKPLFHEGYEGYRAAFEASKLLQPEQVERVMGRAGNRVPGILQGAKSQA